MSDWQLSCPACRRPLHTAPKGYACECGMVFPEVDGIVRLLAADRAERFDEFLRDYTAIRHAEGRGSVDPEHYRRLPDTGSDDPLAWQWSMRAASWHCFRRRVLPKLAAGRSLRIVDVGAGNGWLSNRLADLGHEPMAVDVTVDPLDGLGAARHFPGEWLRVQAEMDRLPSATAEADVVLFNASFHYSEDYEVTVAEALRVLRPNGRIVILDTPIYRSEAAGLQMAAERHADFAQRFGTRSDAIRSIEYLTEDRLDVLGRELGVRWSRTTPWYGWKWWWRPYRARLARRREPSRFRVLVGSRSGIDPDVRIVESAK